jgi:hypothetical protein
MTVILTSSPIVMLSPDFLVSISILLPDAYLSGLPFFTTLKRAPDSVEPGPLTLAELRQH